MGFFDKFNKGQATVREGINTRDMEFRPLKDFVGREIVVDGFFFTEGKYGEQVVVVGAGYLINMPERATEEFKDMKADKEALELILSGKLKLVNLHMIDTKNGTTVAYTYADN